MADWSVYAKAARNTARRQAPAAKEALKRGADVGRAHADSTRRTARATAQVAGRRYTQAHMTSRILAAFRDTSIIAISVGVIWFVFSRVVPIPATWAIIGVLVLVLARVISAVVTNPYVEADPSDPHAIDEANLPEGARISRRRRR